MPKFAVLFGGRRRDLMCLRRSLHRGCSDSQIAPLSAQSAVSNIVDAKESITDNAEASNPAQSSRNSKQFSVENPRKLLDVSPLVWPSVYFELGKGKLSGLVTFTAAASYAVAIPAGMPISFHALAVACAGTALSAMGASAFNQVCTSCLVPNSASDWTHEYMSPIISQPSRQVFEVSNDRRMARTSRRPLPSGKLTVPHAAAFAALSSAAGVGLLAVHGSPLVACLAGGNVVLYALCYTPLKQISIWNTWVGAIVGAGRPSDRCPCEPLRDP